MPWHGTACVSGARRHESRGFGARRIARSAGSWACEARARDGARPGEHGCGPHGGFLTRGGAVPMASGKGTRALSAYAQSRRVRSRRVRSRRVRVCLPLAVGRRRRRADTYKPRAPHGKPWQGKPVAGGAWSSVTYGEAKAARRAPGSRLRSPEPHLDGAGIPPQLLPSILPTRRPYSQPPRRPPSRGVSSLGARDKASASLASPRLRHVYGRERESSTAIARHCSHCTETKET